MASKDTHITETDIYDITPDNMGDKLKEHFGRVMRLMRVLEYKDLKMVTRIKELSPTQAVVITDIEKELRKLMEE